MTQTDGEFERFFGTEYPGIVRALLPILGDERDAEAVAQDAFVKAMTRWRRVRGYDRPGAWVRRVAIRDGVRAAARSARTSSTGLDGVAAAGVDVAGNVDLYAALPKLSPHQRAAVVLHHLAGWPVHEVADGIGCAESTVRVHLHRGRRALAALLEPQVQEVCDERG